MTELRPAGNSDAAIHAMLREMRAGRRRALTALCVCSPLMLTIIYPPRPWLVWNASASAPVGLYAVAHEHVPRVGEMVVARMPEPYRLFAAKRHYLPANVPLVKRVAAASGDRVCASGASILVNGVPVATRLPRDGAGRPMPWWSGCAMLRDGALLLLMDNPASFDGRYFGPTAHNEIVGGARLMWPRQAGCCKVG